MLYPHGSAGRRDGLEVEGGGTKDAGHGGGAGRCCRGVFVRSVGQYPFSRKRVQADDTADPPSKDIHAFYGVLTLNSTSLGPTGEESVPLTVENVLWANTVLAAGSAVGLVVYTGRDTRAVMNTGAVVGQKMGRIEWEINKMAKVSSWIGLLTVWLAKLICRFYARSLSLSQSFSLH